MAGRRTSGIDVGRTPRRPSVAQRACLGRSRYGPGVTPPRRILRVGWALHKVLFRASGGRLGTTRPGRFVGTLFLMSRGRTTGTARRNAIFYIEDGSSFVVVASNAGEDTEPSWWRNLRANPNAEVEVGRRRIAVRARAATEGEDVRLWPRLDAGYREYAAYRRKATRRIAIVILEPRPG